MRKALLIASLFCLTFLMLLTAIPTQNPLEGLASNAMIYQNMRMILGVMLIIQIITAPPRHIIIRIASGLVAAFACVWALQMTFFSYMPLLDSLSLLAAGVATGITALELTPEKPVTIIKGKQKHYVIS